MTSTTPAEDRAWLDHVASLRRKKITFNEDEIWALYRLLATERTTGTRKHLPDLAPELDFALGMALSKLSDAVASLQEKESV